MVSGGARDDRGKHEERLPVGKLPAELLGRLLSTYATGDPAVLVGPGIGGDAAAIRVGGTTLVVKSDPITGRTLKAMFTSTAVTPGSLPTAAPAWLARRSLAAERPGVAVSIVKATRPPLIARSCK